MLVASMLFIAIQPGIVRAFASEENLSLVVAAEGVPVGTKVDEDGFRQIKYKFQGRDVEITDNDFTNSDPETDGEYITWMSQIEGRWQIFYYHVTTGTTIQLTHVGNNVNPVISGNKVAWEGQVDGVWQIFVFDGIRTKQITNGDMPSLSVDIDDNVLAYSTKESETTGWKVYMYDTSTKKGTLLTPDTYGTDPFLDDGRVKWTELIDKKASRQFFQYKEVRMTIAPPVQETPVEEYVGIGDSVPDEVLDVVEATESIEVVATTEEEEVIEEETTEEVEDVVESTESGESEEVLGTEDTDGPEEVTIEDIIEELGIEGDTGVEEDTEQTTDPISDEVEVAIEEEDEPAIIEEPVEETEEVEESTESN